MKQGTGRGREHGASSGDDAVARASGQQAGGADPAPGAAPDTRSMTGFGAASGETEAGRISVEIKAVNGRFLKVTTKLPPSMAGRELEVEALLKSELRRGSVTVTINEQRTESAAPMRIDESVVRAYQEAFRSLGLCEDPIPTLPGVLTAAAPEAISDPQWTRVVAVLQAALAALVQMRRHEGAALVLAVNALYDRIVALGRAVRQRAPQVVQEYQVKLRERIDALLADSGVGVDPQSLAREVAFFADRCDITEETERLAAHVTQARQRLADGGDVGRPLEFLAQEMLREVNTMGSKSADAELAALVVQLKSEVERVKEQVANIE